MSKLRQALRRGVQAALKSLPGDAAVFGCQVLLYHAIGSSDSPLALSRARFRAHLEYLKAHGWRAITLGEYLEGPAGPPPPAGQQEVLLTFDDATVSFLEHAAPLLAEFGFPAVLFAVSDFVGGRMDWLERDRKRLLSEQRLAFSPAQRRLIRADMAAQRNSRLLSWRQLRSLQGQAVEVESHTFAHRFLDELRPKVLRDDLCVSRWTIEDHLDKTVRTVAYPYGCCTAAVAAAAQEAGYTAGFLASWHFPSASPFALGRHSVGGIFDELELGNVLSKGNLRYQELRGMVRGAGTAPH